MPDGLTPSPPSPENKPAFEIPAELKQFEGMTPRQIFESVFPNVKFEILAGLMCGIMPDMGIPIPEWVKKASRQLWKYYFGNSMDVMNSVEDQGAFARLLEEITGELKNEPVTEKSANLVGFFRKFGHLFPVLLEKQARAKSPEETAQFFIGRVRGSEAFARIKNPGYLKMVKRAPIYLCIAIRWQNFEQFTSKAEAERWMRAEKNIGENITSREVSAVLSSVGLSYRGPGRPKKPKTDASNSTNQDSEK